MIKENKHLETEFDGHGGVGQGCIVDGKNGEWYGLIFQDRGGVGRVPCLMPCTWTVSYTHLDVYKRQYIYLGNIVMAVPEIVIQLSFLVIQL